jgi:hypothetical protein
MPNCFDDYKFRAAANKSGKAGEQAAECVAGMLKAAGYSVSRQHRIRNIIADLFVRGIEKYPGGLIVSIKTQFSSGTAEQKLLHEVVNLHKTGVPSFVLLIGNGWTRSLVDTVDAERGMSYRNVKGFFRSLDEFLQWSKDLPTISDNGHEFTGFTDELGQLSLFASPLTPTLFHDTMNTNRVQPEL